MSFAITSFDGTISTKKAHSKMPEKTVTQRVEYFALYRTVLAQQPKDKNKVYSPHEPQVYCVAKGKTHKQYEHGGKASIVSTRDHIIAGVPAHDICQHDSDTLYDALNEAESIRKKPVKAAVVDKGYCGAKSKVRQEAIISGRPLKQDSEAQRQRKRSLCKKRSPIEPVIGHLKQDYRLCRNYLNGFSSDQINLLMVACVWNLKKWMNTFFWLYFVKACLSKPDRNTNNV